MDDKSAQSQEVSEVGPDYMPSRITSVLRGYLPTLDDLMTEQHLQQKEALKKQEEEALKKKQEEAQAKAQEEENKRMMAEQEQKNKEERARYEKQIIESLKEEGFNDKQAQHVVGACTYWRLSLKAIVNEGKQVAARECDDVWRRHSPSGWKRSAWSTGRH